MVKKKTKGPSTWKCFCVVNSCFASFWPIVHMDPVKALFQNLISGWKNPEMLLLHSLMDGESAYFAYRWRHRPTPRPLTFNLLTLRCLITTTMVDYMFVFVPQKILSLSGLLGENLLLLCHYTERKRIMDDRLAIFIFFYFCSGSPSAVCLYTVQKHVAHAPSILLSFWWISNATYSSKIWTTACWVVFNESVWMQTFLKRCQGRRGWKWSFWYMWTRPKKTEVYIKWSSPQERF